MSAPAGAQPQTPVAAAVASTAVVAPTSFDPAAVLAAAQQLLFHEALLLDQLEFRRWLDLFSDDSFYWMPLDTDAQEPTGGLNLIYADRRLLGDRVFRVETREAYGQDPLSRTVHQIGNVLVTAVDEVARTATISSAFTLCELRRNPRWYAGRYVHRVRDEDARLRITYKKVELLESEQPLPNLTLFV